MFALFRKSNHRGVVPESLAPHFLGDDVERPALHLVVDAAEVLAENADHEKLHAAEEEDPSLDLLCT